MHFNDGQVPAEYNRYIAKKLIFLFLIIIALVFSAAFALSLGSAKVPLLAVFKSLLGISGNPRFEIIVLNIRLPQGLAAVLAGAGLAVSGASMQSILRNPLGSPFTLGISHAAAFGAAFSVMILGSGVMASSNADAINITNPYVTTISALIFSLCAAGVIMAISRIRGSSPEVMILAGVALGALFTAGTMFLQYFADDVQLAAMVFWTFGDTARASWPELIIIGVVTLISFIYFMANSWNYNAIEAGDETAKGLGVKVQKTRLVGMLVATMLTAVIISFLGIIGFVGLVVPHMVRRLIGSDLRFLLPGSFVCGALLLLLADTAARLMLAPQVLPVSILTAFLGAPVFLFILIQKVAK